MLKLNLDYVIDKLNTQQRKKYNKLVLTINKKIGLSTTEGCNMMGWYSLPNSFDSRELLLMHKKANEWHKYRLSYVVVIGIGGSYVGVRAAIDMCSNPNNDKTPEILWLHNMGSTYINSLLKKIKNKRFAIVVISKSGTTIEPSIGFHLFRQLLQKQVGVKQMHKYIVAITDKERGTLHDLAKRNNYTMFTIPNNIGGRFSVLTAVGLFPMLLKKIDVLQVLSGARQAINDCSNNDINKNSAYMYACLRHFFYSNKSLSVENLIVYDPSMTFIAEMWRQIFGESEGKNKCGLYPDISLFTTDLHSMGQFLQEGSKIFFETTLWVNQPLVDQKLIIQNNIDNIRYLNNKTLHNISRCAFIGTLNAHTKIGKSNNIVIEITKQDAFHFGYLFLWFSIALTISAYLLGVNPFNQPGVEAYKANMFKLLGKK